MDDDAPKIGLSIMEFGSYGIEPQLIKLDFIIYLLENLESTLRLGWVSKMSMKVRSARSTKSTTFCLRGSKWV